MNAFLEFDEKEFWIQFFSIAVRRGTTTEDEDTPSWDDATDSALQQERQSEQAR